jgi:hypothetical protein
LPPLCHAAFPSRRCVTLLFFPPLCHAAFPSRRCVTLLFFPPLCHAAFLPRRCEWGEFSPPRHIFPRFLDELCKPISLARFLFKKNTLLDLHIYENFYLMPET